MILATDGDGSVWPVFLGASLALVLAAFLSVLLGDALVHLIPQRILRLAAGLLFLAIGGWLLVGRSHL